MNVGSYNREIVVNVRPDIAFRALTNEIGKWWGKASNGVNQIGDEFTIFFESDQTQWKFRVLDIKSGVSVDMECIEADHKYSGASKNVREEWLGTKLQWRLEPTADGSCIHFTHDGLIKELECYEICVSGWNHFFVGSLKRYLNEGVSVR